MRSFLLVGALACCLALGHSAPSTWSISARGLETFSLGIAFVNETYGYINGDQNGAGPSIQYSSDGGVTWTPCDVTKFGIDFMLLGLDASADVVISSSEAGEMYSKDFGATWHFSWGGGFSQSVRFIGLGGTGHFGVAGVYKGANGVAITLNGGQSFTSYNAHMFTSARYAVYPTEKTWFIAGGEFPSSGSDDAPSSDDDFAGPTRHTSKFHGLDFVSPKPGAAAPPPPPPGPPTGIGYQVQISRTTDGGQTWKSVFGQNRTFYANDIDASPTDPNHVCFVGEAFSDSPVPGARIYCSWDGGNTWNRTFFQGDSNIAYSLISIRFVTDKFIWAAGGELGAIPSAWFIESQDGGLTWTMNSVIPGFYAMDLSVVDENTAFAAIDNTITQESGVAKYSAK